MIQYRFHFLNEENVILTDAEYGFFLAALKENPNFQLIIVNNKGLQVHNMTYFEPEEVDVAGEDKVIKPPTPAELREEKAAMSTTTPTDLGHQLDHPDLGKNE